ncbi:hypothetical protein [Shewanella surugensis]|uniref:Uncharacterized protein n=1 Tax=Shewanella surugensis TaxID=212020 RepID=A0ABT0LB80_9GAMM|nr:hypothetical protein [Shewanella surugensis]MCL1124755.1 hypothetical protein [Shewanella surugensis]
MKKVFLMCITLLLSSNVMGVESFVGKITVLEPSYMPLSIAFHMDSGNATCPAGTQLRWSKTDTENNKVVYSTLLAAQMSGRKVKFYLSDDDSCMGQYLHLLDE